MGAALLAATLMNGLGAYAKRVGMIERTAYERYWLERCGARGFEPLWLGLGRRCVSREMVPSTQRRPAAAAYAAIVQPPEWPLKAGKDVVLLGLVIVGAIASWRRRPESMRALWLPGLLTAWVGFAAVTKILVGDVLLAVAGLRSFSFLAVAMLWIPIASRELLGTLAFWCVALLISQCVLLPGEVLYGISDRPPLLHIRTAATLVHPNTLGVLAVSALGFVASFARSRRQVWLAGMTSAALVAWAGSGLGWVALVLLATTYGARWLRHSAWMSAAIAIGAVVLSLSFVPALTGRGDALASLYGRVVVLEQLAVDDVATIAFGKGLGLGTNTAATQRQGSSQGLDSSVTLLVVQGGILTLGLLYALLLRAFVRGREERPFLGTLLLCSVAADVLETFPVNVMLGLCLAYSFRRTNGLDGA